MLSAGLNPEVLRLQVDSGRHEYNVLGAWKMIRVSVRPVVYSGVAKFETTLFSLAGHGEFDVQHFGR